MNTNVLFIGQTLISTVSLFILFWIIFRDQTEKNREVRERLYSRRLYVYKQTRNFIKLVIKDADVTDSMMMEYEEALAEADFLFSAALRDFLNLVAEKGESLNLKQKQFAIHQQDPGSENPLTFEQVEECRSILRWFEQQRESLRDKFTKEM
ncbi:hypothetical protein JHU04_001489 [Brenneria sp. 4F2]|nr:hypothetical protein [Brenneria bubanii]